MLSVLVGSLSLSLLLLLDAPLSAEACATGGLLPYQGDQCSAVAQLVSTNISFEMWDENGCSNLNITCSGYGSAEITMNNAHGSQIITGDDGDGSGDKLITISAVLQWSQYGWAANSADNAPINNTFYCMVSSPTSFTPPLHFTCIPAAQTTSGSSSSTTPHKLSTSSSRTTPPKVTTSTTPTRTPKSTSSMAFTSTPSPTSDGPGCTCNFSTSWNDIMFIFDVSTSMGNQNLDEVLGYIQTTFAWANIQKASCTTNCDTMHTRIGVITYASNAKVVAPLGTMSYDDLVDLDLNSENDLGTNIGYAIELAVAEFVGSNHRPNAAKVIVLLPTVYNAGNYHPPSQFADEFKSENGTIVVYDYLKKFTTPSDLAVASNGYYLVDDIDGTLMQQAMCDANCYCPLQYFSFQSDSSRSIPTAGCYKPVTAATNEMIASKQCGKYMNGYLAEGKSSSKATFLSSLYNSPYNYWNGIVWDAAAYQWVWIDQTPVTGSYQPWYPNSDHVTGKDCVYVTQTTSQWVSSDCRNAFAYICEAPPCDSTHYCSDSL